MLRLLTRALTLTSVLPLFLAPAAAQTCGPQ